MKKNIQVVAKHSVYDVTSGSFPANASYAAVFGAHFNLFRVEQCTVIPSHKPQLSIPVCQRASACGRVSK